MSSEGEQNSMIENENAKQERQCTAIASIAKDEDESLSLNKCPATGSETSIYEPPDSTASVASTGVPFWKDRKFWIHITLVGVQLSIIIYIYMNVAWKTDVTNLTSCRQRDGASDSTFPDCICVATSKLSLKDVLNIASEKEFIGLLDEDWEKRKKILQAKLEEKLTKLNEKLKGLDGQLNLSFSEISKINMQNVGVLLTIVVFGASIFLVLRQKHNNWTIGPVHETGAQRSSSGEIIEKLSRKKIQMGTLIVSFDGATHQFHRGIFETISANNSLSVREAVIQNFGDLMRVEPHKLVIIFVDSNERHIILENLESEIGDFKNQTTDVFITLGCDVFVVYCKDKGSQNLSPDNLYNPQLKSVERHPVLSKLKERERVISVNTKFHPHQVSHLESCCNKICL